MAWLIPSVHGGKFWGDGGGSGTYFGGGLGLGFPIGYSACNTGECDSCQAGETEPGDLKSMATEDIGSDAPSVSDDQIQPPSPGDTSIGMG